jgi:hypothetical protein
MVVKLTHGRKILFGGRGAVRGLSEFAIGEDTAKATADNFTAALASFADLVAILGQTVGLMVKWPDKSKWNRRLTADTGTGNVSSSELGSQGEFVWPSRG